MASLLRGKKKSKKSPATQLVPTAKEDVVLGKRKSENLELGGSQVSVREALQQNVTDNTELAQTLQETGKVTTGVYKSAERGQKRGTNPVVTKPAWRGQSLEKEKNDDKKQSVVPGPSSSASGTAQGKTTLTKGKNSIEPLAGGDENFAGSLASLRSLASFKEAWSEDSDTEQVSTRSKSKGRKEGKVKSLTKAAKNEKNSHDGDNESVKSVVKGSDGSRNEQQAYVPYSYARDCIAHMMSDMNDMKTNHVRIVRDIEANYHLIEDETQAQFNSFVLLLRTEYSGKVKTFRQVIEVHRLELQQKEGYWNDTLASLVDGNNQLLRDKKHLMIKNKVEIDRLDNEKNEEIRELRHRLDETKATGVTIETENSNTVLLHKTEITKLEEENKTLAEQLEAEKSEVKNLLLQLRDRKAGGATLLTAVHVSETDGTIATQEKEATIESSPEQTVTSVVTVAMTDDERDQLEAERQKITDERKKMEEERKRMAEEQEMFILAREDKTIEGEKLQTNLTQSQKCAAEWKTKYEIRHHQLAEFERLRMAYNSLKDQYEALAMVASVDALTTENTIKATQENLAKTEADLKMMKEAKQNVEKDITKWEKQFEKKNGRSPTEEDKSDSVKEMYIQRGEVETMVDSLDRKKETLQQLQSGAVPVVKEIPQTAISVAEPVVTTVEVKVPDAKVVRDLEECQRQVDRLQAEVATLTADNASLQGEITDLSSDLSRSKQEAGLLKAEIEALQLQGRDVSDSVLMVAPASVDAEQKDRKLAALSAQAEEKEQELEVVRQEKREMQKDLKKLLRQQSKVQAQVKTGEHELNNLLSVLVTQTKEIHTQIKPAGEEVSTRLDNGKTQLSTLQGAHNEQQNAVDAWEKKFKETNGRLPKEKDRDTESAELYGRLESTAKTLEKQQTLVNALTMLRTGAVPKSSHKSAKQTESAISADVDVLEDKVVDLETENDFLKEDKERMNHKIQELEDKVEELEGSRLEMEAAVNSGAMATVSGEDTQELEDRITNLQKEIVSRDNELMQEKVSHDHTKEELDTVSRLLEIAKEDFLNQSISFKSERETMEKTSQAKLQAQMEALESCKCRLDELEKERLSKMPPDTAKEMKNLQAKIAKLEKEKGTSGSAVVAVNAKMAELQTKLDVATKSLETQRAINRDIETKLKKAQGDKEKSLRELSAQMEKKDQQRVIAEKKATTLEKRVKELEAGGAKPGTAAVGAKVMVGQSDGALKKENGELKKRIKEMEAELKRVGRAADVGAAAGAESSSADKQIIKRHEKILKELEKKLDLEKTKREKQDQNVQMRDEELAAMKKENEEYKRDLASVRGELVTLGVSAKEGAEAAAKVTQLEADVKRLTEENKVLTENFNSERVLRKKYYNMVEDMKGKIRVYCRSRPLSNGEKERGNHEVVKSPDEYTIQVDSSRGLKEFQFDQIFMGDSTQEKIFEDTNNLIQSAVDGYNVCIFAYGQTGSGKTFTMIGDQKQNFPGIVPRSFDRIFEVLEENKSKYSFGVSSYMLELYNDQLIDLYGKTADDRLEVRKDKQGMVFVQGAAVMQASNSKELFALFEEGSKNRHTASTKMNAESSRSHLVLAVIIESTNKATGQVTKGKLSLVDLAGSERVGKTGASAEQLKEAMSINKSLSALGDVISALSSEQTFIPYRNHKLTMLMQDSLGGNAKTLMFVNISPADYNCDESVISLTYASRVKLITNSASKNADNKEIAKLKDIINKLKQGEQVDEEI